MRTILSIIAVALALAGAANAAEDLTWHRTWEEASQAAQKSRKYVLVYVHENGHPACVEMNKTLQVDEVTEALTAFEVLALSGSSEANAGFCEKYRVGARRPRLWGAQETEDRIDASATPAYLFLDASGREYYRTCGYYPPAPFIEMLRQAAQIIDWTNKLSASPNDARVPADLGHLYLTLDRSDLGKPLLERAVKLDPQNAIGARSDAELDLTILMIPDNPQLAFRQLVAYQFNNPDTKRGLEVRYYMAVAELANNHFDQAERILMDFQSIPANIVDNKATNPDYTNRWTVMADLLLKQLLDSQKAAPKRK
jgi:thioredoxin-related protein